MPPCLPTSFHAISCLSVCLFQPFLFHWWVYYYPSSSSPTLERHLPSLCLRYSIFSFFRGLPFDYYFRFYYPFRLSHRIDAFASMASSSSSPSFQRGPVKLPDISLWSSAPLISFTAWVATGSSSAACPPCFARSAFTGSVYPILLLCYYAIKLLLHASFCSFTMLG